MILLLPCALARAEVTCEQLVAISEKTINLRNQGASLPNLLAETEDGVMKRRFTPTELEFIRLLIRESFTGAYSAHDVNEACQDGRLSIPVQKTGQGK
jgi:hypothetical protein